MPTLAAGAGAGSDTTGKKAGTNHEENMYKAFACDAVVIEDGDERLLRYCVSEVSELSAREALERYLKDQRWKTFSIRQIRAAIPGEVTERKLPVGGIKLIL
jgi:hypothetical protein